MPEQQEQIEVKRFRGEEGVGYVNLRVCSILGVSVMTADKLDLFPQFFILVRTLAIHNLPNPVWALWPVRRDSFLFLSSPSVLPESPNKQMQLSVYSTLFPNKKTRL